MYIFYIDKTGNLDTKDIHPGMDQKYSKKDWLYVLTGLGIFEHKRLALNADTKLIIMSDMHRGDGTGSDDFAHNSLIYKCALDYYLR